jgi:hypothetical protein
MVLRQGGPGSGATRASVHPLEALRCRHGRRSATGTRSPCGRSGTRMATHARTGPRPVIPAGEAVAGRAPGGCAELQRDHGTVRAPVSQTGHGPARRVSADPARAGARGVVAAGHEEEGDGADRGRGRRPGGRMGGPDGPGPDSLFACCRPPAPAAPSPGPAGWPGGAQARSCPRSPRCPRGSSECGQPGRPVDHRGAGVRPADRGGAVSADNLAGRSTQRACDRARRRAPGPADAGQDPRMVLPRRQPGRHLDPRLPGGALSPVDEDVLHRVLDALRQPADPRTAPEVRAPSGGSRSQRGSYISQPPA